MAATELADYLGTDTTIHHPGAVQFQAHPVAIPLLNRWSRSLHRLLLVIGEYTLVDPTLSQVYQLTRNIPIERYIPPETAFGVSVTRHGNHAFTSMDIADRIGQAIVDRTRDVFGTRLPVDLDDPTVHIRAYLRENELSVTIDTTGDPSLHTRAWRVCEHTAPLQPTIAHAMLRLVGYRSSDILLDPMCGGGTLPIEAARWGRGIPPAGHRQAFPYESLAISFPSLPEFTTSFQSEPTIRGHDIDPQWVACAQDNVAAAGLDEAVTIAQKDALETPLDADVIAVDLPFGIRTDTPIKPLYRQFSEALTAGNWDRFVGITTAPELLALSPTRTMTLQYGGLTATIVLVER